MAAHQKLIAGGSQAFGRVPVPLCWTEQPAFVVWASREGTHKGCPYRPAPYRINPHANRSRLSRPFTSPPAEPAPWSPRPAG